MSDGMAAFGRELQRRRELVRPKMSANDAGRRAGITGQWWRQIERGLRNTPRENVVRMAMVVGWDPDDALVLAGYDGPATVDERRPVPVDPLQVIQDKWDRLTDRQRTVAAEVVVSFAEPHAPLEDLEEPEPEPRSGEDVWRGRSWRPKTEPAAELPESSTR